MNSAEAAHELFEKKSSLYSDRCACLALRRCLGSETMLIMFLDRVRLPMLNELYVTLAFS